jgi:hypothetical protein
MRNEFERCGNASGDVVEMEVNARKRGYGWVLTDEFEKKERKTEKGKKK